MLSRRSVRYRTASTRTPTINRRRMRTTTLRRRRDRRGGAKSEYAMSVGEEGLEPSRVLPHRNLNPARLPIPPLARLGAEMVSPREPQATVAWRPVGPPKTMRTPALFSRSCGSCAGTPAPGTQVPRRADPARGTVRRLRRWLVLSPRCAFGDSAPFGLRRSSRMLAHSSRRLPPPGSCWNSPTLRCGSA